MLEKIVNSKSKTFIAFCVCFLTGIIIASIINQKIDFIYFYFFWLVFGGFLIIFWREKNTRFVFIALLLIVFGAARYVLALPHHSANQISFYNNEYYTFFGVVSVEPDIRIDSARYVVQPDNLKGKVYLNSDLYPRYDYGNKLKIECDLFAPKPFEDFRYDMYLARMGVWSVCFNAKIEKIGVGEGNLIVQNILTIKQAIAEKVNSLWHEPYAGFMAGLLYGYRGGLGGLQEDFNRTGVTHIVAISGYNISIIATILITFFVHLRIPRKKSFYLISVCIFLFVIFAGAGGSIVRAGIMGFLVLLAGQLGRLNRINNAIVFTAALMSFCNPFVLAWDAGFQLSFLAAIGLIYLSPVIQQKFYKFPEFWGIKESFISTLSAIIITLPLILYQFGRLSVMAPLVNILILWLIPWIMLFGFLSVVFSFIFYPFGQFIAWISFVGLKYITSVVSRFSALSFAAIDWQISLWFMFGLYCVLLIAFWHTKKPVKALPS